jgi:hypothetical protein
LQGLKKDKEISKEGKEMKKKDRERKQEKKKQSNLRPRPKISPIHRR